MSKWISVKDELPEENQGVLITDGDIITAAYLDLWGTDDDPHWGGQGFSGYEWEWDFSNNEITHWMPLPAPPEVS